MPPIDPFGSGAEPFGAIVVAVDGRLLAVLVLALAVLAALIAVTNRRTRVLQAAPAVRPAPAPLRGVG